jgi:outer membrane protein OmpA-like peptidoglycan-associated protein
MKITLNILLFLLLTIKLISQEPNKPKPINNKNAQHTLKQANKQFSSLKYAYAIPLYKNYLKIDNKRENLFEINIKDSLVYKHLGESYKLVNQYDSALLYYKLASKSGINLGNIIPELQAMLGDYKSAKKGYDTILSKNKTLLNDKRRYGFGNINKFYTDSLDFKIYYTKLNTSFNEYNAVPFKEGIVFESNRILIKKKKKRSFIKTPEFTWDGSGFSSLYYIDNIKDIRYDSLPESVWKDKNILIKDFKNGTSNDTRILDKTLDYNHFAYPQDSNVKLFSNQMGTKLNIGSISFTENGKTAYYTRNGHKTKNGYLLEIWEAKLKDGKWIPAERLFFNKYPFNYFHPSITPDGKRLYYVSDEIGGFGGTDIYYTEKNEDGSWRPTSNLGQEINTEGNELFPSFYDGIFFFSSNGHAGLGGLDIFRLTNDASGDAIVKNLGYPINSDKEDFGFSIKGKSGFFSSNRNGSDDIYAFDFAPAYITLNGNVSIDSGTNVVNKKIYLQQRDEIGRIKIIDTAILDNNGNYSFKARPNKDYTIITYDNDGVKLETPINSQDYVKINDNYTKQISIINIPLSKTEFAAKNQKQAQLIKQEENQKIYDRLYAKTVDSLMKISKDYVELHHPFNQVFIIKKDLKGFENLIKRVKNMIGREIVIVSATDCNGSDEYNEDLSQRRAKRIFKTLNALSNNKIVIKHVGERELLKACDDVKKSIEEQVVNRYSYVFILVKK